LGVFFATNPAINPDFFFGGGGVTLDLEALIQGFFAVLISFKGADQKSG